jgi:hypothetical protein
MYESNELKLIHEICGPIMADRISKLIIDMKHDYDHKYDSSDHKNLDRIDACFTFLSTMDNDKFNSIYMGIPEKWADYEHKDEFDYCYIEYTRAILSDPSLINRCLAISEEPLNMAINNICRMVWLYGEQIPWNFDVECYRLLWQSGCNIINLISIAERKCDYTSIKFIIDILTERDINYMLSSNNHRYFITDILLIDKCKQCGNDSILSSLHKYIIKISNNPFATLPVSYYIINIMNYEDGLNYMKELKKSAPQLSDINTLLAYHFRPRGTYTKGAIAAF